VGGPQRSGRSCVGLSGTPRSGRSRTRSSSPGFPAVKHIIGINLNSIRYLVSRFANVTIASRINAPLMH